MKNLELNKRVVTSLAGFTLAVFAMHCLPAAEAHGGGGGGGGGGRAGAAVGHSGGGASESGFARSGPDAGAPTGEHNFVPTSQLFRLSNRLRTGRGLGYGYGYGFGGYGYGYGGYGWNSSYGSMIDGPSESTIMDDNYQRQEDKRRASLGASQIVKNCR